MLVITQMVVNGGPDRRVVLVLNGLAVDLGWLKKQLVGASKVVAVDGGVESLYSLGVLPDYWVGDGDSSSHELRLWLLQNQVDCYLYDTDKSHTDGYLALQMTLAMQPTELCMVQALGGRFDHQLANLGMLRLASYSLLAGRERILDKDWAGLATAVSPNEQITILPPMSMQISGCSGKRFSLQAYGGAVGGLVISGAKYNLLGYDLQTGEDLTVSNSFRAEPVSISWMTGDLLLWVEGDCRWRRLS